MTLVLSLAAVAVSAMGFIISLVYDRKKRFPQNFTLPVSLILLSTVTAMFGAKWGHGQSYLLSLWIQSYILYYFFYYFLHQLRLKPDDLIQLILILGYAFLGIWYIQYIIYPTMIVDTRMDEARGTIRLFLPGGAFAGFIYFYYLDKFLKSNKIKFILFCLLFLLIAVLQGTRSSIATQIFGTVVFILFSTQVRSKVRNLVIMAMGALLIFFLFQDIFMNLVEVTEKQASQQQEDIRIRAAKFYLTDFYPNKINYLIGNGVGHMMSSYGMRIAYYKTNLGFFQSDIGLVGDYTEYGVLFVIGVVLILWKIFTIRVKNEYVFIKYWAVIVVVSLVFGSPFGRPSTVVVILSALYIMDVSNYELNLALSRDAVNHDSPS